MSPYIKKPGGKDGRDITVLYSFRFVLRIPLRRFSRDVLLGIRWSKFSDLSSSVATSDLRKAQHNPAGSSWLRFRFLTHLPILLPLCWGALRTACATRRTPRRRVLALQKCARDTSDVAPSFSRVANYAQRGLLSIVISEYGRAQAHLS